MAIITKTTTPMLRSTAQVFVLPVNSTGKVLNPVVSHCKNLFPDNYQVYRQNCVDGKLTAGMSLLIKRKRDKAGLSSGSNKDNPSYIVNLLVSDHPYHPPREQWIKYALQVMAEQMVELIRFHGIRHIAFLTHPLIYRLHEGEPSALNQRLQTSKPITAELKAPVLDWETQIYPLIQQQLQDLPKVRIDLHLPNFLIK